MKKLVGAVGIEFAVHPISRADSIALAPLYPYKCSLETRFCGLDVATFRGHIGDNLRVMNSNGYVQKSSQVSPIPLSSSLAMAEFCTQNRGFAPILHPSFTRGTAMTFPFEFGPLPAPIPKQDEGQRDPNRAILLLIAVGFILVLYFLLRTKKSAEVRRPSASLPVERWKHWRPTDYE